MDRMGQRAAARLHCLPRALLLAMIATLGACATHRPAPQAAPSACIQADVVALEQAIVLNRFGAFNPAGTLYALLDDVVWSDGRPVKVSDVPNAAGQVRLRSDKRPRPLVLRVNEGQCLEVRFHNLLMPQAPEETAAGAAVQDGKVPAHREDPTGTHYPTASGREGDELVQAGKVSADFPRTRTASFHVIGLEYAQIAPDECPRSSSRHQWLCGYGGDNVGLNTGFVDKALAADQAAALQAQNTLPRPGQSAVYRYRAVREGTYFAYSTGASVGGEGDGGQLALGLFGAVNVQPKGAKWYRSQVTSADLRAATKKAASGHPFREIDYDDARYTSGPLKGRPILAMLDGNRIVHSDLNAVIALTGEGDRNDTTSPDRYCKDYVFGTSCGKSYREFTVVMHDEVKAVQAFPELEDETNPLYALKDNMGINYGVGGMGAMVVARNRGVGPAKNCPECRAEEFFLSSWANGDPALLLRWDRKNPKRPVGAMYPDDPSNVHHSYLNDAVRFRNLHAGPKETHVFHLHAHQWVMDPSDPGSTYLDSQTISPGATFSYEIEFGGSGNRNLSPGDSIFHCHLYPHFAQGMWELWRVHDVFEDGTPARFDAKKAPHGRNLPDAEVIGGTENPAIVPLPGNALPPMPTAQFRGYPFYVPGEAGHRPPQPPLDMDVVDGQPIDGGLPRHVLRDGNTTKPARTQKRLVNQDVVEEALKKGGKIAQLNAAKVYAQNPDALYAFAEAWESIGNVHVLEHKGEPSERTAMDYHAGRLTAPGFTPVSPSASPHPKWEQERKGYATDFAASVAGQAAPTGSATFFVNGRAEQAGAPYADPCPAGAPQRQYKAAFIQTELTLNRHGWLDPQARIISLEQDVKDIIDPDTRTRIPEPLFFRANSGDCITYKATNLVPNALSLDDFQVYTPTDTIGQHIHLVKFDVTSSDGSGNGWNYEDGTFSPDEVRERVFAMNRAAAAAGSATRYALRTHPLFAAPCPAGDGNCETLKAKGTCPADAHTWDPKKLAEEHPFCGAQRTVQRWYADPILHPTTGKDYTLRTVFTHDHFGPSSHQQHGLYSALVVEPSNSVWLALGANDLDWTRLCSTDAKVRAAERAKVIGGAMLAADLDGQCAQRLPSTPTFPGGLREPIVLRDDGGPTSTRVNVIAPVCLNDYGTDKTSNPLDPAWDGAACAAGRDTRDTRREFAVAFADFAIMYDMALEPINPEQRDLSPLRLGRRQVAMQVSKPLGISLEDPGSQLINYRHEPAPLRITDVKYNRELGGFDYSQHDCPAARDGESDADRAKRLKCTGDSANLFSTLAHAKRDRKLATTDYWKFVGAASADLVSPKTRGLLAAAGLSNTLDGALDSMERWRRDFSCALYPQDALPGNCRMAREEPWREMGDPATPILPAYEGDRVQIRLIQGAQEAQHVFTMNGVRWLKEPGVANSGYVNAQPLGISEHFEFDVNVSPIASARTDHLYFGSSIDQLWDGMWGLLRSYGREADPKKDGETRAVVQAGVARLNDLKGAPLPLPPQPALLDEAEEVCAGHRKDAQQIDVVALRACELQAGGCGAGDLPAAHGVTYNRRLGFEDPNAIVFMRLNRYGEKFAPFGDRDKILAALRLRQAGKPIEPLVLRAPAGACLQVKLRNLLPPRMPDGPDLKTASGEAHTGHFGHNLMSMITDGFNYNQIRMSSSIGLAPTLLSLHPATSDGANVGINGKDLVMTRDGKRIADMQGFLQGTLAPPCAPGDKLGLGCTQNYTWWAGDFSLDARGAPNGRALELGAVPLRSLGDPIKHPAHGAIGALVIGPKGSKPCSADDAEKTQARICDASGKELYHDVVVMLQDAVDATQNGWPVPNLKGAEEPDDYGVKAINYRTEPIWGRRGGDPSVEFEERHEFDYTDVLSSKRFVDAAGRTRCQAGIAPLAGLAEACDPETPVFSVPAGAQVRVRVVHPGGHTRQQAFALSGHHFNPMPFKEGSTRLHDDAAQSLADAWITQGAYNGVGPSMAANLLVKAGGENALAMDYLFRSQASFLFDGGIWGLLRVTPAGTANQ